MSKEKAPGPKAPPKIVQLAKKLADLKARKDVLDEKSSELGAEIKQIVERDLPQLMGDAEIDKISIANIGTLYLQEVVYADIPVEAREAAYDWLREHGHGSMIKETVNAKSLASWAKEQLSDGASLPEFIRVHLTNQARLRRA